MHVRGRGPCLTAASVVQELAERGAIMQWSGQRAVSLGCVLRPLILGAPGDRYACTVFPASAAGGWGVRAGVKRRAALTPTPHTPSRSIPEENARRCFSAVLDVLEYGVSASRARARARGELMTSAMLCAVHSQSLVHRDVKPDNVLVSGG